MINSAADDYYDDDDADDAQTHYRHYLDYTLIYALCLIYVKS